MSNNTLILEHQVPLAASCCWQAQGEFYQQQGINAFQNVPYYITSNPFIAERFAASIARFLELWYQNHDELVTVLELGAGTGQFSYYCNKALARLTDKPVRYIVTDMVTASLDFCRAHAKWQDLDLALSHQVEFKRLDLTAVAEADCLNDLNKNAPLIVIANYVFDSLPMSAYYVQPSKAPKELLLSLTTPAENAEQLHIKDWRLVDFNFQQENISSINDFEQSLLSHYSQHLTESSITIPLAAIKVLETLTDYAGGLLLMSLDNGLTNLPALDLLANPIPSIDGALSFPVNFHAIEYYFLQQGGAASMSTNEVGIKQAIFASAELQPLLPSVANLFMQQPDLAAFFTLQNQLLHDRDNLSLEALLAWLRLGQGDPVFLGRVEERAKCLLQQANYHQRAEFEQLLSAALSNQYLWRA